MLISHANSANSIAVIRFIALLEISVDLEGKHGQGYCNCQTGYRYKLKLEHEKPVKPVENWPGEDNENPQHFIHESTLTIAYNVIDVNLFLPLLMRFLPKKTAEPVPAILLTTIPFEPNTAHRAYRKP